MERNGIEKGLEYAIESKNYKNLGWTHADLQIQNRWSLKILKYQQNNSKNIYIRVEEEIEIILI